MLSMCGYSSYVRGLPLRFTSSLSVTLAILVPIAPAAYPYEQEVKAVSVRLAQSLTRSGKKTVAVVDFTDLQGNVTELGRFLAEEFSVALAGEAIGFEVIDRTHLKAILQEHKLSTTGLIDPQTARKLGQIAGVEALVTGSITPFGDSVRVSVKVLDTSTAKMVGAATADIPKTKAIEELLARWIASGTPSSASPSGSTSATGPSASPTSAPTFETESYPSVPTSMRQV